MTTETAAARARGMHDIGPDEMERVRAVEDAFASACRAWGYREVRTPVIEPLHLFTAAGTLSPRTLDQVYSFLDWDGWSGERVVLRPDSTIAAARFYSEQDGDAAAKLFYTQNVFRFTEDGSSREEWQCGVELIGDSGRAGDVEIVLLALESLGELGLPPLTVKVSHAGIVRAVLAAAGLDAREQAAAYDRLLDGDMSVVDEIEARLPQLTAPLRLLFDVEGAGSPFIANVRGALAAAIPQLAPALDELAFVVATLEARGLAPVVQAVLARSFEYYSGLVFKIYEQGERICSGGRYDELIGLIGGRPAPACGFAIYVAPTAARMTPVERPGSTAVRVTPADATPRLLAAAHAAAGQLRLRGVRAQAAATSEGVARTVLVGADGFTLDGQRLTDIDALAAALERVR